MDNDEPNTWDEWLYDEETKLKAVLNEKMADAMVPGFEVGFDPEEADFAGAFIEDALSAEDALESTIDLNTIGFSNTKGNNTNKEV